VPKLFSAPFLFGQIKSDNTKKMEENQKLDWAAAEEYLREVESAYAETGSAGVLAMTWFVRPLRDRFNRGERTEELHDEIMEIAL